MDPKKDSKTDPEKDPEEDPKTDPKMDFFKGAQNFTMGNVQFNTTQGDYYDNSTRNVRNTYGDRNRYYTNNKNRYYNNSTNYNGDYYAPAARYHRPVNNVGPAKNVIGGGFVNQRERRDYNQFDGPVPHPDDPYPPPGPPPAQDGRPGPRPYDQHFTATQPAVPQHEGFPQRRGPPRPNLPHLPESDDGAYQNWGQQQGPPPAFPPMGVQGFLQHPPQDPSYRPMGAPSGPAQQQRQRPQQQWQGPEEWPGQHAYNRGMAKLRNNTDLDSDEEMNRGVQKMEDPSRRNYPWNRGPPQSWQQRPQRGYEFFPTSALLSLSDFQTEHIEPENKALLINQARGASSRASADCQSATFGARDALGHINSHRDDILEPLGVQHALTSLVLAGFNEAYIREGIGLLQEIHIMTCKDLELDESALAGVGKACSPFPSFIFMPSGKCFQPPLYDQDGKDVPLSALGDSVCKLRYSLAIDKGLSLADERIGGTVTSHHATSGSVPASEEALPTSNGLGGVPQPARTSQSASSNQSSSSEEDERRSSHAQNSTQGVNARQSLSQRLDPDALPQDPPGPDTGITKRLRNIYLRLLLAIHQSEEDNSLKQNIQLQASFDFQLDPGKSAIVEFRKLVCNRATASSIQHQPHYLHRYLKVLVDAQSEKWKATHCSPQRTPAGHREIKDVNTTKKTKQGGVKFRIAANPGANLEGAYTSEKAQGSERVRFIGGIAQADWDNEFTWGFDVGDEKEQQEGLHLIDERLPKLELAYLRDARQSSESNIPEELTVEISAFWSLKPPTSTKSSSWWQFQRQRPPKYSNLVHSVRVDLPANMDCDGYFVGEQRIGGSTDSRKVKTLAPVDILVNTDAQPLGCERPENAPRWLPRANRD